MPPRWELRVLGPFHLVRREGGETAITGKKAMALLALLALAPDSTLRREQAMALLWSDRAAEQARSSLRQTLAVLRKEASGDDPPPVAAEGDSLRLDRRLVETDAAQFERLSRSEHADDLRQAALLYRGELLEGLSVADDAFEEWLRGARGRMREAAAVVFGKLARMGPAAERIDAGRRLVALDPLREGSHGLLMQALAASGDLASAIRQFENCKAMLKAELGIAPSAELAALSKSLQARPAATEHEPPAMPAKPTVAVLPFDNLDGDPAQRYFSDGISEDIITGLSRFRSLFVVARHSSFQYRDRAVDVRRVAEELGVRYLVAGSVRRIGGHLRISAQLIDAVRGTHLWSERYDRDVSDLFAIQDEVTRLIVSSLTGQMQEAEIRGAIEKPTESLQAYDCLLRGIDYLRSYGEGVNRRAIEMFERAIALDPRFGLAHGYLGLALLVEHKFTNAPAAIKERALASAMEGVRLAPDDARCRQFLGDALLYGQFRHQDAIMHYRRSLEINPDDANGLVRLGLALAFSGRAQEGVEAIRNAMRNNPLHPDFYWSDLAIAAYAARDYELALEANRRMTSHGRYWDAARSAAALAQLGRLDEARAETQRVLRIKPDFRLLTEPLLYEDPTETEHVKDGMRKAGLPD